MTGTAMAQMSRAIRQEFQRYAPTMGELPDDVLDEYVLIVGALYGDLREEKERRGSPEPEVVGSTDLP